MAMEDVSSNLCRLCAQSSQNLIGAFSEDGIARKIVDKIHLHLPIQVTAEDCMPTSVCTECVKSLDVSHNLLQVCLDADSKLREILQLPEDPSHTATLNELQESVSLERNSHATEKSSTDKVELYDNQNRIQYHFIHSPESEKAKRSKDTVECQSCDMKFESSELLNKHRSEEHSIEQQFTCSVCGINSDDFESYIDHMCSHVNDGDETLWECGNCGKTISSVEALKLHISQNCKEPSSSEAVTLDLATDDNSPVVDSQPKSDCEQLICTNCPMKFDSKEDLDQHKKSHDLVSPKSSRKQRMKGKREVKCRVCGKAFESFWYMARHRSEDHSKEEVASALRRHGLDRENFECNICGKLLSCQFTYKHHLQAHSGVRNHHCTQCGRSFVYLAQLKSHMVVHNGGPHACSECSKAFPNAFALRVHLRTHTGERPFPCEHCPKAFHSRANYEQHAVIHTDKRKYQCHLCSYRARRPEALRTHIRVHTNERPYACKMCGRAFKQKYDCTKHEMLHAKWHGTSMKSRAGKLRKSMTNTLSAQELLAADDEDVTVSSALTDSQLVNAIVVDTSATMVIEEENDMQTLEHEKEEAQEIFVTQVSGEEGSDNAYWHST